MSQIPSDPGTNHGGNRSVNYDELIAVFVAFLTLGSVLFWGLTRSGVNLFGSSSLFGANGTPLVSDLDEGGPLALADDADADGAGDLDIVGFGDVDAIGAAGAGSLFGAAAPSTDRATDKNGDTGSPTRPIQSQPTTTPGVTPIPPPQDAQPADPGADAATDGGNDVPTASTVLEASREAVQFADVPDDYWAKPYIDSLSERLVIDGISDDSFAPEQPVTRAQLASAIAQAFPLSEEEAAIAFSDIEPDYWALGAIDKAVKGGFMNGFPDETFQPTLEVPRVQVLAALVTGLKSALPDDAEAILGRYGDADQIPSWAAGQIAAATQSNIVVNYPNLDTLNPDQPATRAEVAAMIYQALAAQGRVETVDGEYVVKP